MSVARDSLVKQQGYSPIYSSMKSTTWMECSLMTMQLISSKLTQTRIRRNPILTTTRKANRSRANQCNPLVFSCLKAFYLVTEHKCTRRRADTRVCVLVVALRSARSCQSSRAPTKCGLAAMTLARDAPGALMCLSSSSNISQFSIF